jgi:hypothetical protein
MQFKNYFTQEVPAKKKKREDAAYARNDETI